MGKRTLRIGGEVLTESSTVLVKTRQGRVEHTVVKIGTKLIYLKAYGREVAYNIETRKQHNWAAGVAPYFMTHAEAEAADRRQDLVLRLRKLGLQSTEGMFHDLGQYSDEALRKIVEVLEADVNKASS